MFDRLVNKPIKFTPLSQKDDSEAPLSSRSSFDTVPPLRTRVPSWCAISALVITSSCLTGLLGMWAGAHWLLNPDKFCIRHTSQYCKYQVLRALLQHYTNLLTSTNLGRVGPGLRSHPLQWIITEGKRLPATRWTGSRRCMGISGCRL